MPTWKRPSGHRRDRLLDRAGIAVDAADDVAVGVEGEEELAVAAVDLEDTRAGTDVEGLGDVLRESVPMQRYLFVERGDVDRGGVDRDRGDLRAQWGRGTGTRTCIPAFEPGSMIDTEVL